MISRSNRPDRVSKREAGLKNPLEKSRVGSNPTVGTNRFSKLRDHNRLSFIPHNGVSCGRISEIAKPDQPLLR